MKLFAQENHAATAPFQNEGVLIFDDSFNSVHELIDAVRSGKLLIHARKSGMQNPSDLRYGLDPVIGETLSGTESFQTYEENEMTPVPLVFASDDFKWVGGTRNEVIFLEKDGFQKSLGDGRVMLPDGSIVRYDRSPIADYANPSLSDEPAGVETGDWYSISTASVVAVVDVKKMSETISRPVSSSTSDWMNKYILSKALEGNYGLAQKCSQDGVVDMKLFTQIPIFSTGMTGNKTDTVRLYRGMVNKFDGGYDIEKTDAPNGYSTWTDSLELAKQYAGKNGHIYYLDLPKSEMSQSIVDEDPKSDTYGDRALFYFNDKPAGLNGVEGSEVLVYVDHDLYDSSMIKELQNSDTRR